jgi:NodT family efflux transporter outer membrane factor (OMF) lipoprotein
MKTPQTPNSEAEAAGACPPAVLPALATAAVALASAALLTLGGCASSAGIAPRAQVMDTAQLGLSSTAASAANAEANIPADWWRAFGDPALDALVDRALAGSPNLVAAQARVERAEASVAGAKAASGLRVDGEGDATHDRLTATYIYPPPLAGATLNIGNLQASASWELDFFGRNRAAIAAAVGQERAAQAEVEAARNLLASQVASTYVQLGRLFAQREVAERSLAQRAQILTLIRDRVQGGLDTQVELRQGEGSLPETRQQIEELDDQITLARHALAALTQQAPQALDTLVVPLRSVQLVALPSSVPVDLLGRRADIAAARWRIEATSNDIASAKAQFYPNISLTAAAGFTSIGLNKLLKSASEEYSVGPAVHLPIFDAGRLRSNLRGKTAEYDAAVASYNTAVIDAVHDVADQIASLQSVKRQQAQQAEAATAAESAYSLATQRYQAGLGTYLIVLNAEASVLNQRRLGADLKARALSLQIALARALGGGYSSQTALAQPLASTRG